jgi:plastocyanin
MITHRSYSLTFRNVRCLATVAAVLSALVLTACGSSAGSTASSAQPSASSATSSAASSSAPAAADTIVIHSFAFHPATLTVKPGATVTVRNADSTTHTLTDKANAKLFNTGDISPAQTKTFKAPTKPGSYPYFCQIHQFMIGTLIVS